VTAIASASAASAGFRIGLRQQHLRASPDLVLVGVAGADHGLLHLVGRVFRNRMPNIAGASMATPRACPSFSVATPSLLTKVCSTAASSG
jgi:hypothetical protein